MLKYRQARLSPDDPDWCHYFSAEDVKNMTETMFQYTNGRKERVLVVYLNNGTKLELADPNREVGPAIAGHKILNTSNLDDEDKYGV